MVGSGGLGGVGFLIGGTTVKQNPDTLCGGILLRPVVPKDGQQSLNRPKNRTNPAGRLDILAFRVVTEHLLPASEQILGIPGLAEALKPHAEALIVEAIPPVNILKAPKPRRRLC